MDIKSWPKWKEYTKNPNCTIKYAHHWALWINNVPLMLKKLGVELDEELMTEIIKDINKDAISQQDFDDYAERSQI